MGQYHFQPDGCHLYHAGNQFLGDHSRCTVREGGRKWNVLFLGDSHMRFVLHGWQYRLAGHTDYYPEKEKAGLSISIVAVHLLISFVVLSQSGRRASRCITTRVITSIGESHSLYRCQRTMLSDGLPAGLLTRKTGRLRYKRKTWTGSTRSSLAMYAEPPLALPRQTLLTLSPQCAWPAMNGITAAEYAQHLTTGLNVIDRLATPRLTRKVWLTGAPFPPWTRPTRKERRTNAQLAYWNRITKRLVAERGWLVVDQFELGMPLVLEIAAGDGVHLSPSDAHAVIVDDVLAKAGICPV